MTTYAAPVRDMQFVLTELADMSGIGALPGYEEATPDLSTLTLIDYDFKKYGSSHERKRLLQKWDEDVSTLPQ